MGCVCELVPSHHTLSYTQPLSLTLLLLLMLQNDRHKYTHKSYLGMQVGAYI